MRHNLKVPFAEKDEAKKLGARWDAARKLWYIQGVADLAPFARWSPNAEAGPAAGGAATAAVTPAKSAAAAGKVVVGARFVAHALVCDCPPWESCPACLPFAVPGVMS